MAHQPNLAVRYKVYKSTVCHFHMLNYRLTKGGDDLLQTQTQSEHVSGA